MGAVAIILALGNMLVYKGQIQASQVRLLQQVTTRIQSI